MEFEHKNARCACGYEYAIKATDEEPIGFKVIKGSLPFILVKIEAILQKNRFDESKDIANLYACPECGTLKIIK